MNGSEPPYGKGRNAAGLIESGAMKWKGVVSSLNVMMEFIEMCFQSSFVPGAKYRKSPYRLFYGGVGALRKWYRRARY